MSRERGDPTLAEERARPVLWIIDREQWPRACLRAELIERGFDARGYEEIAEAVVALQRRGTARPRGIVLELREQALDRDTLAVLARSGVPVMVLGGMPELNEPVVHEFGWAGMMRRPFSIGEVADRVEELVRH